MTKYVMTEDRTYLSLLPGYILGFKIPYATGDYYIHNFDYVLHITILQLYTFNVECMPRHLHFWAGGAGPFGASAVSRLIWVPGPQHGSRYTCSM